MEPDQIIFNREANDFIFDLTGFFTDFLNQLADQIYLKLSTQSGLKFHHL